MKMNNWKRIIVVLTFLTFALFIGGWGSKKSVDLLKNDLIDLDKAIPLADWGSTEGSGKSTSSNNSSQNVTSPSADKAIDQNTIKVRVNNRKLFVNNSECDIKKLEKTISQSLKTGCKIYLIDDYAETHAYHEADEILRRLSRDKGIKYEAD